MDADGVSELVDAPERGRVFAQTMRVGLADCAPSARMRLDALARWLQDVAYADVEDAGVADCAVWVVRRTRLSVERFPRFGERFTVRTFCSGLGRMWAERRTTLIADSESRGGVEAVCLWVHLDPSSGRPAPFSDQELTAYGDAAAVRRVSARLRHPAPRSAEQLFAWRFRATECDIADHINNAAYWTPLEEELSGGVDPERLDVEMEYRTPCQPGEKLVLRDGNRRWIVDGKRDAHASVLIASGPL
jgi:acyl-ACP thioesterase